MDMNKIIKGYKVFDNDWTCRNFKYEIGQTYSIDESPKLCKRGFHFCKTLIDCFNYRSFNCENKVAKIKALGEIDSDGVKFCTNKIKIVREVPWNEVLNIVNKGKNCTGHENTGDYNVGDYNTGRWNSGHLNTGDYNAGDYNTGKHNTGNWNSNDYNAGDYNTGRWNSGHLNTGDYNAGDYNAGNHNTGDWNTGNYNSGSWNATSFSSGAFNTEEQKIVLFNKPSNWTHKDWAISKARYLLDKMPKFTIEWVYEEDMSNEEKEKHPTYKTTGGYLKISDNQKTRQTWWDDNLSDKQKEIIKRIPNFDAKIFEEITGIKTE